MIPGRVFRGQVTPTRNYSFDVDFLDPSRLPPGTPRFRDIVNLGYRQIF